MKQKMTSLILVISLIFSLFTIYSFASENNNDVLSNSETSNAKTHLHYKNSFGDEADDLGIVTELVNAEKSCINIEAESNGNKYGEYTFNDSNKNVYFQFAPELAYTIGTDKLGYMILEMDFNDFGSLISTKKFFEIHSGTGSLSSTQRIAAADILNIANNGTNNYIYLNNNKLNSISIDKNKWVHIRIELSILSSDASKYNFKCIIGDKTLEANFNLGNPGVITYIRMGSSNSVNQVFGLDNIALYSGPVNMESYEDFSSIKGTLTMKIGAENASLNGLQIELSAPPILINDEIYCPVKDIESYSGVTCEDEYIYTIDNIKYVNVNDIKSAFELDYKCYDMGLILIGDKEQFLDDDSTYAEIAGVMKTFVFNIPGADELKELVRTHTNNFDHPYILADDDRFAELRKIYENGTGGSLSSGEDKILFSYLHEYVTSAKNYLSSYCGITPTGTYTGIKSNMIPVNANYEKYSNNGYDNGGRVSIPTTPLLYFAFAYQMTGHLNYARAAYDYTLALGAWNHWGPDHFLNCADTAAPVAISYDWLYDAYELLKSNGEKSKYSGKTYDKTEISTILFTHVIIPGYVQSNNIKSPWPGSANSRYSTKTSNWNAVCASGAIAAALVILEDDISTAGMTFDTQLKLSSTKFQSEITPIESIGNAAIHIGLDTYSDYAAKLSAMNLTTLAKYGLDQYMPDGSYVESPGYWSYGTNSLFRLIASLLSATGDDFGFMDAWGIDTTCYFAIQSESSDYKTWNFNDGGVGKQDSSFFFFVGDYYGDEELIKVRKKHLSSGKGYSIYDILYYNQSVVGEPQLDYDYQMIGIDAFSVRSSWDKGAIYAGIIGGPNKVSHGHMDAGSFTYHNKGKIWFYDLGSDNYNIKYTNYLGKSKGYFSNFELYRIGAEGHNLIAITSEQSTLPYGQLENADPKIIKTATTDEGGYAVLDMSEAYGSHVFDAKRGMLFTESRNTVIIQDEYVFNGTKTAYWFGHYNIAPGYVDEVVISADGRTAFMISGDDMIRVSIVSDNDSLKFEIMDCYTYLLDVTHRTDLSSMDGASTETNRNSLRKLAIKCENVNELDLAVVIEEVNDYNIGTAYQFMPINDWTIESKDNSIIDEKFKADFESGRANIGSFVLSSNDLSYLLERYGSNDSYIGLVPNKSSGNNSSSEFTLYLKQNVDIYPNEHNYLTIDFDLFTESTFIHGTQFGFNANFDGAQIFVPLIELSDKDIIVNDFKENVSNSWKHLTIIIDTANSLATVYLNNSYFNSLSSNAVCSIESFAFKLPDDPELTSALLLDNIEIRAFSKNYQSLTLPKILSEKKSLDSWGDRIEFSNKSLPLALANGTFIYTNSEIESSYNKGRDIVLLRDTTGLINISCAGRINTRGFRFNYISDSFVASNVDNIITFTQGEITVKWHIGGIVITERYSSSSIAEFKENHVAVGTYSYTTNKHADGYVQYELYTTGWSSTPSGSANSLEEMIVSSDNCEFWLVHDVPVDCSFAVITNDGIIKPYDSEDILRSYLSGNYSAKEVILFDDIEIKNTAPLELSKNGLTVYLNGNTLSHRQNDVHMFIYSSRSVADINFVGPGIIDADTSRNMLTSSSSSNDVTSKFGVVFKGVDILVNTQLADIRVGQYKFINCNIHHSNTGSKHLADLWNKNSTINNGVPANLLTLHFEGCNIQSDIQSSSFIFSYTSDTYAEIYVSDTVIISNAGLISTSNPDVAFKVSGNSAIKARCVSNSGTLIYQNLLFDNSVKTSFPVDQRYIPSDSILTNSYEDPFIHLVSDDYALLTWTDLDGKVLFEEYVAIGITPKLINESVINYLKSLNGLYVYELTPVDSSSVMLTPVFKNTVNVLHSMQIQDDLSINIYIQKDEMDNKVQSMTVDGVKIMQASYMLVNLDGKEYYRYKISNLAPSTACKDIKMIIEQKDGKKIQYSISAVNYLETLLSTSDDENEMILAVKLLKYIQSAYKYFNSFALFEYERIDNIIEKYKKYDVVFGGLEYEYTSTDAMKNTISSVRMNLSFSIRIRFMINPNFSGTITTLINGKETKYTVKNGTANGLNYIEVVMRSYEACDSVVLDNGTNKISYNLNNYAASLNCMDRSLHQLLICLADYSAAAKNYATD